MKSPFQPSTTFRKLPVGDKFVLNTTPNVFEKLDDDSYVHLTFGSPGTMRDLDIPVLKV